MAGTLGKGWPMYSAFCAGILSLILQSASIGTDYWISSDYAVGEHLSDFNVSDVSDLPRIVQHAGLWRLCYHNVNITLYDSEADVHIRCSKVSFKQTEDTPYNKVVFYCEVLAASFACIVIVLQVFGVLSGVQACWQMKSSLYTDCGLMFSFAAIFDAATVSLYLVAVLYKLNERPAGMEQYPEGYADSVDFAWSFYCCAIAFLCASFSGTLYLLIARHWKKQEIYNPAAEEAKDKNKDQKFTYRRSIISIPKL
ncbi:transmembrane protein 114-like [Ptychodera flava]|uniref:transmembrane protein 114-like n=1 Tax=Ptychodera flava TaxID=63121 RepID=UPI00396A5711